MIELTKITLLKIRLLNRRPPKEYPLNVDFEEVKHMSRLELFNYGLRKFNGWAEKPSLAKLVRAFMKKEVGSVTPKGVWFKKSFYKSPKMLEFGYIKKARQEGNFPITVYYLEDRGWELFTFLKENKPDDDPVILIIKRSEYKDSAATFREIEAHKKSEADLAEQTRTYAFPDNKRDIEQIEHIAKTAKIAAKAETGNIRLSKVRENRKKELETQFIPDTVAQYDESPEQYPETNSQANNDTAADMALALFQKHLANSELK